MSEPTEAERLATLEEKVKNLEKLADQFEALKWLIIKAAILIVIGTVSGAKALELILGK